MQIKRKVTCKTEKIKVVSDISAPPLNVRKQVLRRKRAVTQEFLYLVKLRFMCENFRKILIFARIQI